MKLCTGRAAATCPLMSAGVKERLEQYVSVASLHSAVDVEVSACVSFACASEQWAALLAMAGQRPHNIFSPNCSTTGRMIGTAFPHVDVKQLTNLIKRFISAMSAIVTRRSAGDAPSWNYFGQQGFSHVIC